MTESSVLLTLKTTKVGGGNYALEMCRFFLHAPHSSSVMGGMQGLPSTLQIQPQMKRLRLSVLHPMICSVIIIETVSLF